MSVIKLLPYIAIHPSGKYVTLAIKPRFCICGVSPTFAITKTRLYSQGDVLSGSMYCKLL